MIYLVGNVQDEAANVLNGQGNEILYHKTLHENVDSMNTMNYLNKLKLVKHKLTFPGKISALLSKLKKIGCPINTDHYSAEYIISILLGKKSFITSKRFSDE